MAQHQPYAKGARNPGDALTNMRRGATLNGYNPQDAIRRVQVMMRATENKQRGPRPARPARPAR